jgi:hypothetical protein
MGIPSVDLIIDFTDPTATWNYHDSTGDTLSHISVDSLGITGRTVEYFFHEYYVSAANGGGGQSPPWNQSVASFFSESQAVLVSLLIGACGAAGILIAFKIVTSSKKKPAILKEECY